MLRFKFFLGFDQFTAGTSTANITEKRSDEDQWILGL